MTDDQTTAEKALLELFNSFDTDNNGVIDPSEFLQIMKSNNVECYDATHEPTQAEVDLIFEESGYSKNNGMTFEDFKQIMSEFQRVAMEMREKFNFFDTDGNGKIDRKELKEGLKKLGQDCRSKVVSKMIKAADLDGDGQ